MVMVMRPALSIPRYNIRCRARHGAPRETHAARRHPIGEYPHVYADEVALTSRPSTRTLEPCAYRTSHAQRCIHTYVARVSMGGEQRAVRCGRGVAAPREVRGTREGRRRGEEEKRSRKADQGVFLGRHGPRAAA